MFHINKPKCCPLSLTYTLYYTARSSPVKVTPDVHRARSIISDIPIPDFRFVVKMYVYLSGILVNRCSQVYVIFNKVRL